MYANRTTPALSWLVLVYINPSKMNNHNAFLRKCYTLDRTLRDSGSL